MLKALASLVHRHSKWVLVATALSTAAMVPGIMKIKHKEGTTPESNFTSPNDLIRGIVDIKKTFKSGNRATVVAVEALGTTTVIRRDSLEIIDRISNEMKQMDLIRQNGVLSLSNVVDFESSDEGLRAVPIMKKLPTSDQEEIEFENRLQQNDLVYGRLVTKDFKTSIIVGSVADGKGLNEIHDRMSALVKKYQGLNPALKIRLAGTPEVDFQLDNGARQETVIFMAIALVLLIIAFLAVFRTWKGVVIPFTATTIGIVWTMGLMGYYGKPIDIVSALLPVLLVVTGSSYGIHVFHHLKEYVNDERSFRNAYLKLLRRLFAPLLMSTTTTFIGSITLLAFRAELIQHFGLFAGAGTVINFVLSLIVIPAMYAIGHDPISWMEKRISTGIDSARGLAQNTLQSIPVAGPMAEAMAETMTQSVKGGVEGFWKGFMSTNPFDRALRAIAKLVNKHPYWILAMTLLSMVWAGHAMQKVVISFDNLSMLPRGYTIRQVTESLSKSFNGVQSFDVMFDTGKESGAIDPVFLRKLEKVSTEFMKEEHVSHVFSLVDILKKMDSVLNPEHGKGLIPDTADAVSQYMLLLSFSSESSGALSNVITADQSKVKLTLTTNVNDTKGFEQLYVILKDRAEKAMGPDVKIGFGGSPMVWIQMMRIIVWGKVQNILVSLLLIFITIALIYRSVVRGMMTILTLPVGVAMNFGIMGHLGIRLDIVTAIITSFAMGIGVDFAVHFLAAVETEYKKYKDIEKAIENAIAGPGKAIMYNAITTKVGFSALLFSRFTPINTFAVLMCFSMSVLALSAVTVLPAVLRIAPPEFITGLRRLHGHSEHRASFFAKYAFSGLICVILIVGIVLVDRQI